MQSLQSNIKCRRISHTQLGPQNYWIEEIFALQARWEENQERIGLCEYRLKTQAAGSASWIAIK